MGEITDHKGNIFQTKKECAAYYEIDTKTLSERLKKYKSLSEVFSPLENRGFKDHLGNVYKSQNKCAEAYGLTGAALTRRLKKMSLKDALENKGRKTKDHKGNEYATMTECAKAYGHKSYTIHHRLKKGMTLEEALTTPVKDAYIITDHLGNKFNSITECAEKHGLSAATLSQRLNSGLTLEESLTIPVGKIPQGKKFIDHTGKEHVNLTKCLKEYNIQMSTYMNRIKKGWTIRESLVTPKSIKGKHVEINDISLNPLICIHEYSHTVELTGDRFFRVGIISTGEIKYMNEEQIKRYK